MPDFKARIVELLNEARAQLNEDDYRDCHHHVQHWLSDNPPPTPPGGPGGDTP